MKKIKIGIFGCGTVGQGVIKVLNDFGALVEQRSGCAIEVARVVDRSLKEGECPHLDFKKVSKESDSILNDSSIDVVVELIGGVEAAREFVLAALSKGKHVVTANKALLAEHGAEIFQAAKKADCDIYFEASVAGGIPIIKALREGFVANHIEAIYGIVNGTCNYILSKMQESPASFNDVLKEAQEKGYAEADPTFDVEGIDSAHKLCLLASLMSGQWVDLNKISVEGITSLSNEDFEYAEMLGYVIKLLAIAKESKNGELEVRVHPTLLEKKHPMANVSGVYNSIYVKANPVGDALFYGRGAGAFPTASAVVSDIVDVARNIVSGTPNRIAPFWKSAREKKLKAPEKVESEYYLRFSVVDTPGVMGKISSILGKQKISISSVIQKERNEGEVVTVVVLTHSASKLKLAKALSEVDALEVIHQKTRVICLEREN